MKHNISPLLEKVFFFPGSGNRNLFGFLHYADPTTSSIGIIYCHPFAEEKNMSHSVIVKAARMFAAAGFSVFRFDFCGCGDSEGDLQFSSVEDWLQDLDAAIDVFRKETGISQYFLWGLRSGAGLTLLYEKYSKNIAGLILWQPVLDFYVHIKQFLRQAVSSQISKGILGDTRINVEDDLHQYGIVYVIGYPVTKNLYNNFNNIGNQPANVVPSIPVFILSISLMDEPSFALKKHTDRLKESGAPVLLQHITAEPFWDRYWQWKCKKSAETTLKWLRNFV